MGKRLVASSIWLPKEMNEAVKKLAAESNRSKSAYIRQILQRYLQYLETKKDPKVRPVDWDIQ